MDRKSESSTSQQQETAVVQGQCDQYNKWLQFVKPKLANMMVVLQEQYASDGAPIEWIEWTLEKSKAMLDNDIVFQEGQVRTTAGNGPGWQSTGKRTLGLRDFGNCTRKGQSVHGHAV